ncbi:MAG: DUF3253 domain-containing protein [Planctomycetes bacterium]|nr:DUF3253 domain-containing protein [Planctomycetota bacterium]
MHRTLKPENEKKLTELLTTMIGELKGRASIGPADVARRHGGENWKRWMEDVKEIARRLAESGALEVTRHGKPVTTWPWRGVIRFRRVQPASGTAEGANASDAPTAE